MTSPVGKLTLPFTTLLSPTMLLLLRSCRQCSCRHIDDVVDVAATFAVVFDTGVGNCVVLVVVLAFWSN